MYKLITVTRGETKLKRKRQAMQWAKQIIDSAKWKNKEIHAIVLDMNKNKIIYSKSLRRRKK